MAASPNAASSKLSWFTVLAYVLPSFPLAAVGMPLVVHLPQFYASKEIGLSLGAAAAVFGFCRIVDVFLDPTMGYFSDQWRTRWGRRRPMIAIGAPILALGLWMVFVPGGHVSATYLAFWLMLMYVGWSTTVIPHLSWGSELTGDYHERSRIYGWSQASTVTGMVGVLVLPAILENIGVTNHGTQIMAMAIFSVATLLPAVAINLSIVPEQEVRLKTTAGFWPTLKFVIFNRAMRRVILVDLFESINQGARGATFFFFANLALGLPKFGNTLLLIYFITGVLCIPIWIALSRRIGKHRTLIAAYVYGFCMAPLLYFVPPGHALPAAIVLALSGASYGAPSFLLRSMMADVADADAVAHKTERAGLMYSFLALTAKLGIALAVLVTFMALAAIGFDPKATAFAPAMLEKLRVLYIAIPVLLGMISLAFTLGYPIGEKEQRSMRQRIDRDRAEAEPELGVLPTALVPGGILSADPGDGAPHEGLTQAKA
jgi:Na+/melibiose symporter-like transporter